MYFIKNSGQVSKQGELDSPKEYREEKKKPET